MSSPWSSTPGMGRDNAVLAAAGCAALWPGFFGKDFDAPLVADLCARSTELLGLSLHAAVDRVERQSMLEESQRQAMHSANHELLALINDILDPSKVEAGPADLRHQIVFADHSPATDAVFSEVLARLRRSPT